MSLLDRQLPEPSFIERDPAKVTREMIATYESLTGKTLYPAQVERLLIDLIAYRESLVREAFQDGAKLNLVRYSRGVILDNIGENVGVQRVAAVAASVKLRFTFSPAPNIATVLPQGTEVEGGGVSFATDKNGDPCVLFPNEWTMNYFKEKNPELVLLDLPNDSAFHSQE